MQRDSLLARCLLLPVLAYPRLEGLARCRIPSGERQSSNLRVGDGQLGAFRRRNDPDSRLGQRPPCPSVEYITGHGTPIFEGERHIAAIVEGFFERHVDLSLGRERRNPALELFTLAPFGDFELVRVHSRSRHAVVPSSTVVRVSICTSGLKPCTGWTGWLSRSSAPLSWYLPKSVAIAVSSNPLNDPKV